MSLENVSVLIICQNVERTLKRTLDSVKGFGEVIIIDGGSSDQTKSIACSYENVVFYTNPWPGFVEQRNFSLDKATKPWCFMLDADEACTEELKEEIGRLLVAEKIYPMYSIVRTEFFLGEPIEVGLGRSDYQQRLFKRDRIRYTGGTHHQHLLDGQLLRADSPDIFYVDRRFRILHDQEYGMVDWLKKLPRFSINIAHEKIERGRRVSAIEALFTFPLEFLKVYLKSWRGGAVSFVNCLLHATYAALVKIYIYQYYRFLKFNEKQVKDYKRLNLG